jgi:hypothetical protein
MARMKTIEEFRRKPFPMSWPKRLGLVLTLELAWFMLLHPLLPSTLGGFVVEFSAGLIVFAFVYGAVRLVILLMSLPLNRVLSAAASITIAVGVGAAIFGAAYWCRIIMESNFSYMH